MNQTFMQEAIKKAKQALNEIPIGAVIVKDNKIIATAYNQKEATNDPTAHAEIIAIKQACKKLGNWRLTGCEIYVTLEPCPMCAWAILQSRISKVYFGSYDTMYGAFGSKLNLIELIPSKTKISTGILQNECDNIINNFFQEIR